MNTEIIVALIGMAATAWAPTVTAYVNRDKELRLKKLEIYQQCKKDAYINFSTAFSKLYRLQCVKEEETVKEIITACHQVLIYCSRNTAHKIVELIRYTDSMPYNDTEGGEQFWNMLYDVMDSLNREIKDDCE